MARSLRFRLLMPFKSRLRVHPGGFERDSDGLRDFWGRAHELLDEHKITVHHAKADARSSRYQQASGLELNRPLELLSEKVPPARWPAADVTIHALNWHLMDHGFGVVEASVTLEVENLVRDDVDDCIREQGEQIASSVIVDLVKPVLKKIASLPRMDDNIHIEPDEQPTDPEWVTRALLLPEDADTSLAAFAKEWIKPVDSEASNGYLIDEILAGKRYSVARWLNHVYRDGVDLTHLWTSLQRAQFIWTTADEMDLTLNQILAQTMKPGPNAEISVLRSELQSVIDRAQGLMMTRNDIAKYATPKCRHETNAILQHWDFERTILDPLNEKMDACQSRIQSLSDERSARASMFTDIILMTIGVSSILATALALVAFGREASLDPAHSTFDYGQDTLSTWLASQSIDAIVILATLVSLVLGALFIWARQRSIS